MNSPPIANELKTDRLQDTPEAVFRRRVLDRTALVCGGLTVVSILIRHINAPLTPLQLLIGIGLAGLTLSTPILSRRVRQPAATALPLCFTLMILIIVAGWQHGGLRAPVAALLPMMPLLGFFFGGKRLGAALLIGSVAVTAGLLAAGAYDLVVQVPGDLAEDRNKAIVLCVLAVAGYLIGAIYERSRRMTEMHLVEVSRLASLGFMAAGIAHEINNPLTVVAGFSDRLVDLSRRRELDPEVVGRMAERIAATTMRMADIVAGLRTYSRDDARDRLRPCSIKQIVDETLVLCKERFRSAGIDLRVGAIDAGLIIMARPVQMTQVLINLLNNALDAASQSAERWVAVEVAATPTTYTISVVDSGPGVPEDVRSKIFVPFFTTKEVGKGTGLGLSLCANIMRQHNGQVVLAANAKWTTFVLHFPAAKAETPAAA